MAPAPKSGAFSTDEGGHRLGHLRGGYHDHVCPECQGLWSHNTTACEVPEGDPLLDPCCEAQVRAGMGLNTDPIEPDTPLTAEDLDADYPSHPDDDATGFK